MCTASRISVGIALIAADRTTIAKPVCTQIMMTMSSALLRGWDRIQFGGCCAPSQMAILLGRPVCGCEGAPAPDPNRQMMLAPPDEIPIGTENTDREPPP